MQKHVARLLHGSDDGHYSLPEEVLRLRDAVDRLDRLPELRKPPHPEAEVWPQIEQAAAEDHIAGRPLPNVAKVIAAAQSAYTAFEQDVRLRRDLAVRVNVALDGAVWARVDEIITQCLQPALGEVVNTLVGVAELLPPDASPGSVVGASEKVRTAWLDLEQLAIRYNAIRHAWATLGTKPELDDGGEFAEFANVKELWPNFGRGNLTSPNMAPWPADPPAARLLWLAHHGAEFIVPTAAEQDRLYWSKYGEQIEAMRANRHAGEGFRALWAG